jgi:predicted TIM-barrel fold metal-dependent hydrolase
MEEYDITACVLSAPAAANDATGQEARDIARRTNELLAEIVSNHPNRFGAVATLPALDADGAMAEISYALDTLKLDGVTTTTSINDVYLGEPQFDPWLEELDRRSATFFVHPTITKAGESLLNGLNASVIEFMFDTTRMVTNMVATGAKKRFSQIEIIAAHGGGTVPFLVNRIQTLEHTFGVGPGRLELSSEEVREGIASFYYDLTAATSEAQLGAILKLVPVSQLLMGLDNPFMPKSSFAPAIADVGRYPAFSETDLRSISYENAFRLYPELAKRIGRPNFKPLRS